MEMIILTLVTKDGTRKDFPLPSTVTIIGRKHDCDLCIPLMGVSRRHCEINQDNGRLKIRDLDSRNGTYLNGKKVSESLINPGDRVSVGPLDFTVSLKEQPDKQQQISEKMSSEFLREKGLYDETKQSNETEIMNGISQ